MHDEKIQEILKCTPIISNMVTLSQVKHILNHLNIVLEQEIQGDILELGCNVGTTSIFIRKLLDQYSSSKKYCVYDSFEGLPSKQFEDESDSAKQYYEGACKTSLEKFIGNFEINSLSLPIINQGWFKEIDDEKYPSQIAFAFFDGDFYSSIMDSFEKVYHKLSPGARVILHDYGWESLPGVEKACNDFLQDKPEKIELLEIGIGLLTKQ